MSLPQNDRLIALVKQLKQNPGFAEQLPSQEGAIVRAAVAGQSVYEIAQQQRISDAAVWDILANAARAASGQPVAPVESGGLGSDTAPGDTGGYGNTGFGSQGNDESLTMPERPESEQDDEE